MKSPSVPQSAFVEVQATELDAVHGGSAVPSMTATEYVNEIMKNVPPSYGDPNGGPAPCGNGLGFGYQGGRPGR